MKWHHKALFFTFAIVVVGLIVGVWKETIQKGHEAPSLFTGTAFAKAKDFPRFTLIDDQNNHFNQNKFTNQWSLVFFGYTTCPELCPKTLKVMSEVKQIVGLQAPISMYIISINPEEDTPEQMNRFLSQPIFKKGLITGLTGQRDTIKGLAETIGLFVENEIPDAGHIGHSGTILVINPKGQMQALFSQPSDAFLIAKDLQKLMRFHQQHG